MSKIRVRNRDDLEHKPLREYLTEDLFPKYSEADLDSIITVYEPGSAESLQMFEVVYGANEVVDLHSHDDDELIYIVEGEIKVGNRLLTAGSTVYVTGDTLYGFSTGPNGVRFVNFRGRADWTFRTAEEFKQRRKEKAAAAAQPQ